MKIERFLYTYFFRLPLGECGRQRTFSKFLIIVFFYESANILSVK